MYFASLRPIIKCDYYLDSSEENKERSSLKFKRY